MGALEIVQLINTGIVGYRQVAPLLEDAIRGKQVTLEDVARASGTSTEALKNLLEAIVRAKSEGR